MQNGHKDAANSGALTLRLRKPHNPYRSTLGQTRLKAFDEPMQNFKSDKASDGMKLVFGIICITY